MAFGGDGADFGVGFLFGDGGDFGVIDFWGVDFRGTIGRIGNVDILGFGRVIFFCFFIGGSGSSSSSSEYLAGRFFCSFVLGFFWGDCLGGCFFAGAFLSGDLEVVANLGGEFFFIAGGLALSLLL